MVRVRAVRSRAEVSLVVSLLGLALALSVAEGAGGSHLSGMNCVVHYDNSNGNLYFGNDNCEEIHMAAGGDSAYG